MLSVVSGQQDQVGGRQVVYVRGAPSRLSVASGATIHPAEVTLGENVFCSEITPCQIPVIRLIPAWAKPYRISAGAPVGERRKMDSKSLYLDKSVNYNGSWQETLTRRVGRRTFGQVRATF